MRPALSCLAFAAGVLCVLIGNQPLSAPLFWLAGFFLVALLLLRYPLVAGRWALFTLLLTALCWAGIGAAWATWRAEQQLARNVPAEWIAAKVSFDAEILGLPEPEPGQTRFQARLLSAEAPAEALLPTPVGARLRLSWREPDIALQPGERWRFTARLKPPHGMLNFAGFDYEAWLFANGINGTGYVLKAERLQAAGWRQPVQQLRSAFRDRINASFTRPASDGTAADARPAALLRGLLLGDRSGIDQQQWQTLRATGTAHLMAISGLHIGLAAALAYWLVRLVWPLCGGWTERIATRRIAALVGAVTAVGYAALAGFQVPAQRALIMVLVVLAGLWWRRPLRPFSAWAAALALVLLWDPRSVLSGGFWLSFAAVFWIIYALAWRQPRPSGWRALLQIQLALGLALWPISLFWFGEAAWVAPFINLLAVPLMAVVVMPALGLGLLLWPLVGTFPLASIAGLLVLLLDSLAKVGDWTVSAAFAQPTVWLLLGSQLGLLWLLAPRGWPLRSIGVLPLLALLLWRPLPPVAGDWEVTMFDVGQGLSMLVRTQNHALLYDAGARFRSGFDLGERIVVPELQALRLGPLDAVIASHADNDHYGGMPAVLAAQARRPAIWLGGNEPMPAALNAGAQRCRAGHSWNWDGVQFRFLAPLSDMEPDPAAVTFERDNDHSCVLHISGRHGSALLTGDIESRRERALLRRLGAGGGLRADLLQVPHHGSHSSSGADFIAAVQPRQAWASAGFGNRFRHPAGRVVDRYTERGIPLFSTRVQGALRLQTSATGLRRDSARQTRRRFWRPLDFDEP